MYDLVTIGDIKLDTFVVLPHATLQCQLIEDTRSCLLCIEHGAKIPVHDFDPQIAGSATNVAVGLSRMKFRTAIYSIVGDDATGRLAFARFKDEGVSHKYVKVSKREKSSFSIVITYKNERTILAAHQPHHYRLPKITPFKWLFISEMGKDYEQLFRDVVRVVKQRDAKLAFNPGAIQLKTGARKLKPMLKATTILFVNSNEGHRLLNKRNTLDKRHLITSLWKLGPNVVVVTDGPRGAYAFDGGEIWFLSAFKTRVVEMTGAGDSFATGFLAAYMSERPLKECLRWGAANASSVIGEVGPQPGLLTKTGVISVCKRHAKVVAKAI